jgi:hypothetical protein
MLLVVKVDYTELTHLVLLVELTQVLEEVVEVEDLTLLKMDNQVELVDQELLFLECLLLNIQVKQLVLRL